MAEAMIHDLLPQVKKKLFETHSRLNMAEAMINDHLLRVGKK